MHWQKLGTDQSRKVYSLWISTPPCSLPLYSLCCLTKSTISTIWASTGNTTGRCVCKCRHFIGCPNFTFTFEGSQWNACMLPVDVQIVERVHFVKKKPEGNIGVSSKECWYSKRLDFPWSIGTKFLSVHVKLAEISMCDCKKSKMKVCPFLPFSYGWAWEIDGKMEI